MHQKTREQVADAQRDAQTGSKAPDFQMPFRNVTGIRGCAVVIVFEWCDLRLRICRDQAILRIERFGNIVIDAQGPVEEPLPPRPGLVLVNHPKAIQRCLRQKRTAGRERRNSSSPE